MKAYLGWGAFLELCEYLLPDIELAIEKETGEKPEIVFDSNDKELLGSFPDEYLYALKRLAAHLSLKGTIPERSFIEDTAAAEDDELITYIDNYKKGAQFASLVFFSESLGVYLPVKGLKEPLHFEHEDKDIEICSVGSLYQLKEDLLKLKEQLGTRPEGKFDENLPWHIEFEILDKLLSWTERAIREKKPLVLIGEGEGE